jgi:hypothetical protein
MRSASRDDEAVNMLIGPYESPEKADEAALRWEQREIRENLLFPTYQAIIQCVAGRA